MSSRSFCSGSRSIFVSFISCSMVFGLAHAHLQRDIRHLVGHHRRQAPVFGVVALHALELHRHAVGDHAAPALATFSRGCSVTGIVKDSFSCSSGKAGGLVAVDRSCPMLLSPRFSCHSPAIFPRKAGTIRACDVLYVTILTIFSAQKSIDAFHERCATILYGRWSDQESEELQLCRFRKSSPPPSASSSSSSWTGLILSGRAAPGRPPAHRAGAGRRNENQQNRGPRGAAGAAPPGLSATSHPAGASRWRTTPRPAAWRRSWPSWTITGGFPTRKTACSILEPARLSGGPGDGAPGRACTRRRIWPRCARCSSQAEEASVRGDGCAGRGPAALSPGHHVFKRQHDHAAACSTPSRKVNLEFWRGYIRGAGTGRCLETLRRFTDYIERGEGRAAAELLREGLAQFRESI